uniref:Ctd-like (NLI interacting factor-like) phosphatase n=1 Tax=Pithovirus LCPAC102 TaxID=2506587 RepID=A0A481Z325_9VIRU|nr:MAG: ctd-like (NLI interacting factor-like) phosphatase [Pithovirus LCPAC102]
MNDPKLMDIRKRIYVIDIYDIDNRGDGKNIKLWGIERPYLREFLKFCMFNARNIIVWTAGIRPYAEKIVKHIFRGIGYPSIIYSREHCVNIGSTDNPQYTKPISKLINSNYNKIHKTINMNNTIIIDDRIDYIQPNFSNAIVIPPYNPVPTIDSIRNTDIALLKIMTWFNNPSIRNSIDIKSSKKDNIFMINPSDIVCVYSIDETNNINDIDNNTTLTDNSEIREKIFTNLLIDPIITPDIEILNINNNLYKTSITVP